MIPGFSLISHFSRTEYKKGGVAIYIKQDLENCIENIGISHFCEELTFEAALVKIKMKKSIMHVMGTYRSPNGNLDDAISALSEVIEDSKIENTPLIIMGDINVDILEPNRKTTLLNEALATHNIVRIQLPATRITHNSESSIDWICTNMNLDKLNTDVIKAGLSDHTAQTCVIHCNDKSNIPIRVSRRFRKENLQNLKLTLASETWSDVYKTQDPEEAFKLFINTVRVAMDSACPHKKTKMTRKAKLQFHLDPEAKRLKQEYLKALNNFEKSGNTEDKRETAESKKNYDLHLKLLRKNKNSEYINSSENKSKAMWNTINTAWSKNETMINEISLQIDGTCTNDVHEVAEHLNLHFTSIAEKTLENQKHKKKKSQLLPASATFQQLEHLEKTNVKELVKIINKLKAKTSSGIDEVSSKVLKFCCNELVLPLVDVINKSLRDGLLPSPLKVSKVYPKFKNGSTSQASNYRPISLVSTFSKLLEKVVLKRILDHCSEHNLLNSVQHGFTKGKSTTTAITQMVETLIDGIENGNLTTGIFLDFSKAFDCLEHDLIIKKLESLGIVGTAKKWFQSYLSGRSQLVELRHVENGVIREARSSLQSVERGVPQGSVMGPVLFILFINDLPQQIGDACLTLMYADDTTLILNEPTTERLAINSYISLNMAYQYCHNNDLSVNTKKTSQVAFGRKANQVPQLPDVEMCDEAKFLGVTLDKNLTWTPHIDNLCKKLSSSLFAIKRIKEATDDQTTLTAYYALFESHVRYGLVVWGGTSNSNLQRVLKLQKRAVRTLFGLQRLDSCREAFKTLKILTIVALYIMEAVMHAVNEDLPRRNEVHQYNLRNTTMFDLPTHRMTLFEKKPTYIGRRLHNHLPDELRTKNGKDLKPELRRWLSNRPLYSLEEFFLI